MDVDKMFIDVYMGMLKNINQFHVFKISRSYWKTQYEGLFNDDKSSQEDFLSYLLGDKCYPCSII
jgi:hypothetical protein